MYKYSVNKSCLLRGLKSWLETHNPSPTDDESNNKEQKSTKQYLLHQEQKEKLIS